jgi:hypothetical protein
MCFGCSLDFLVLISLRSCTLAGLYLTQHDLFTWNWWHFHNLYSSDLTCTPGTQPIVKFPLWC